jgi:hypothetical protein
MHTFPKELSKLINFNYRNDKQKHLDFANSNFVFSSRHARHVLSNTCDMSMNNVQLLTKFLF